MKYLFLLLLTSPLFGADIYFAQSSAGSNNGTSCANAYAASRFNTADSNWTAGNTLHICGTWTGSSGSTALLATRGSGSSGNPITILFESGAKVTAPYWDTSGAFQINHNFIVLDGGTACGPGTSCSSNDGSGIIESTANGTSLANQVDSEGLHLGEGGQVHDVEIKNMVIRNMCVRTGNLASSGTCNGNLIKLVSGGRGGNILIHDNTFHDGGAAAQMVYDVASVSGDKFYNNYIYHTNSSFIFATLANITVTGLEAYGNEFSDFYVWDNNADDFHHECFHLFTGGSGHVNGALIYNNYAHGDFGVHATACVFIENAQDDTKVFNNYIAPAASSTTDGMIFTGTSSTNTKIYNNTLVGSGPCVGLQGTSGVVMKNNILSGCSTAVNVQDSGSETGFTSDNNVFRSITQWAWGGSIISTFSSWKSSCSCDASSVTTDPLLNSNGTLQSGSSAISLGANLTGLSITQLNSDKNGIARPSSSAWDSGAFQFIPTASGGHGFRGGRSRGGTGR